MQSNIHHSLHNRMNDSTNQNVMEWPKDSVTEWARVKNFSTVVLECINTEEIDGKCLLTLTENDIRDFRDKYGYNFRISDIKKLWLAVRQLQKENASFLQTLGMFDSSTSMVHHGTQLSDLLHITNDLDRVTPPISVDGHAHTIPQEYFKTMISLGYAFLVTWITAFVMVVVHERVPDMKRYPPLPDIFLDNVPHIPWAFHMCEATGTVLFLIWISVLILHKHRMVLLRRFFALAGTVFLLRCVTMLITSLSVPGTHLQCNSNDHFKIEDMSGISLMEAFALRISRAYTIWSGLGMSIQGVRTCGDYMFSGHTVALTLLNFFITEYTPRKLYFLHTLTWLLNMFGIFFILAAHEHYSIDVFVAFYISSRLFLYYHTLANNQALMSHDSNRTRIWFPMFSYFESAVDGIIPNDYDSVADVSRNVFMFITYIKDLCMLTAQRFWVAHNTHTTMPQLSSDSFASANSGISNGLLNNSQAIKKDLGLNTSSSIVKDTNITAAINGNKSSYMGVNNHNTIDPNLNSKVDDLWERNSKKDL